MNFKNMLKAFINTNAKVLVAILYAISITLMVSLFMYWSKVIAIIAIFVIVFELTFFSILIEFYDDDEEERYM